MQEGNRTVVGLIWAQGRNRELGAGGRLPWSVPEDLRHFARATQGSCVIMGRATWESLPAASRPLPGRRNIVLSRQEGFAAPGAEVARSLPEALARARSAGASLPKPGTVWVIGGAQAYESALAEGAADVVELTEVDAAFPGADAFAPDFRADAAWECVQAGAWQTSETGLRYRFSTHRKAQSPMP